MIKLLMIGNLTKDPEMRTVQTDNGERHVTNFTLASNGRREGDTTYVRITAWDRLAETCAQYLAKGRKAYVTCNSVSARTYQAQDGTSRISLEATANEVEFLSARGDDAGNEQHQSAQAASAQVQAPAQQRMDYQPVVDDELPF